MPDSQKTLAVLGCGFMGTALLTGVLASTPWKESQIKQVHAAVQRPESAKRVCETFSAQGDYVKIFCNDNLSALDDADVVILGFLPGDVKKVLGTAEMSKAIKGKLIISMLAGVSCAAVSEALDDKSKTPIVRVVPSIGAQINESASLVSNSDIGTDNMKFVQWLFGRVGTTEILPEELLNAAIAVSATCHALVTTAIDSIVEGSVSRGIPRQIALKIASQCFRGASSLLLDKMTVEELKDSMSVPRGITTEAWINLEVGHVRTALSQTVRNAVDYAENMA